MKYNYLEYDIDKNIINSPIKNFLHSISIKISDKINSKLSFIEPNHITTLGLVLNAFALLNLINGNFLVFILLFFTGYFCDILDGTYAKKFNKETEIGKFYDKFADWVKLLSVYVFFTTLYKNKIDTKIVVIVLLILILCNFHYIIKNNIKKYNYNKNINLDNLNYDNKNIIEKIINTTNIKDIEHICVDLWIGCFKNIKIKNLKKYITISKYFDETMIIMYLIIIMIYIHNS